MAGRKVWKFDSFEALVISHRDLLASLAEVFEGQLLGVRVFDDVDTAGNLFDSVEQFEGLVWRIVKLQVEGGGRVWVLLSNIMKRQIKRIGCC